MGRRRTRGEGLPLTMPDKTAEYAGYQWNLDIPQCGTSKMFPIFKDSIYRLLFSNFKWYGLSDSEAEAIEWHLINEGRVVAVKSEFNLETQSPDGVFIGRWNMEGIDPRYDFYGKPLSMACSGRNGTIVRTDKQDNFTVGYDTNAITVNQQMIRPIISYTDTLCYMLDNAYQALMVAAETRKVGMVFQCSSQASAKLLRSVLSKRSDNNPYIVITGDISNEVEVLFNNNASAIAEYHQHFMNIWGIVLDMLGLENNQQNKKERVIVSEMELNRSLSRYIGADRLKARKKLAERLSELYGTDIQVENYLAAMIKEEGNEANIYGEQEDVNDAIQ